MLPFQNRLTKKRDIEAVFRRGSFFSFGGMSLKMLENKLDSTRIGVVVGVKFSKKATEGNRIKRQIREYSHIKLGEIKKGFDVIIMPKKAEGDCFDKKGFKKSIESVFRKSNLI